MHEPVFWKKCHHFQQKSHPTFTLSRNLISSLLLLFAQILTSFKFIIATLPSCKVSHTKRPLLTLLADLEHESMMSFSLVVRVCLKPT